MYKIIDREAGNIIEQAETIKQAQEIIAEYEAADKRDGTYTPDFYEILNKQKGATKMKQTKKQIEAQEIAEAIQVLQNLGCENGTTIYTSIRSVAKSGMSRAISCFIVATEADGSNYISNIDYFVGIILGLKHHKEGGLIIRGCGMDMGFAIVYNLSSEMLSDGYALKQRWL